MPEPRSPRRLLVALLALAFLALPGPAAAESTGRGGAKATQSASAATPQSGPAGLGMRERLLSIRYVTLAQAWRVGENIAWGTSLYATPSSAVARWMGSPGHRENMLTPSFREVGIGIVPGIPRPDGNPGATYTVDFGAHS